MTSFHRIFSALLAVLGLSLAGCTPHHALIGYDGLPLKPVTSLDRTVVFAASPDGMLVAFARDGLQLLDRKNGEVLLLSTEVPVALGWRRDGGQLAAAFSGPNGGWWLRLFDRNGDRLDEQPLPGPAVTVAWSRHDDLLVSGYQQTVYSFGVNLRQWLLRFKGPEPEQTVLGDVTIEVETYKAVAAELPALLAVRFSPDGDELVYLRLHDPPRFPPYLQLLYRNWQVVRERRLAELPPQLHQLEWLSAEDVVLLRRGLAPPQRIELWPGPADQAAPPVAGQGAPQVQEIPPGRFQPLGDGRYLVAVDGTLYAGAGLPAAAAVPEGDRIWTLRKWRFDGLISAEEFRAEVGEKP